MPRRVPAALLSLKCPHGRALRGPYGPAIPIMGPNCPHNHVPRGSLLSLSLPQVFGCSRQASGAGDRVGTEPRGVAGHNQAPCNAVYCSGHPAGWGPNLQEPQEMMLGTSGRSVTRWWLEHHHRFRPNLASAPGVPSCRGCPGRGRWHPAAPPGPSPAPPAASPARGPRQCHQVPCITPGCTHSPAPTSSWLFSSLVFSLSRSFFLVPSAAVSLMGGG